MEHVWSLKNILLFSTLKGLGTGWPIHQNISKTVFWWNFKVKGAVWLGKWCTETKKKETYSSSTDVSIPWSLVLISQWENMKPCNRSVIVLLMLTQLKIKYLLWVMGFVWSLVWVLDSPRSEVRFTQSFNWAGCAETDTIEDQGGKLSDEKKIDPLKSKSTTFWVNLYYNWWWWLNEMPIEKWHHPSLSWFLWVLLSPCYSWL